MDRLKRVLEGAGETLRSLVLLGIVLIVGCGGGGAHLPATLLDGSALPTVPAPLRGVVGRAVVTRVRVLRPSGQRSGLHRCLALVVPVELGGGEPVVERIGVDLRSLTFRGRPRGWIRGCDATAGPAEPGGPWCGGSVGRLRPTGALYDPRLNILCRDAHGEPVGAAWIEPLPRARYLAVEGPGYTEVYRAAAGLPVRVSTHDVDEEASSATFRVSQYAADGTRLSRTSIRAAVAG